MTATLIDTHVLIWLEEGNPALGREARYLMDRALAEKRLAVSAMVFWEIAMLHLRRRIALNRPILAWRQEALQKGILEIPVTGDIGIAANQLAGFHPDPADRIITATALVHQHDLITADLRILRWPGAVLRHDARQ